MQTFQQEQFLLSSPLKKILQVLLFHYMFSSVHCFTSCWQCSGSRGDEEGIQRRCGRYDKRVL